MSTRQDGGDLNMDVKVGTFNVLSLAREGGRYYPDEKPYMAAESDETRDVDRRAADPHKGACGRLLRSLPRGSPA